MIRCDAVSVYLSYRDFPLCVKSTNGFLQVDFLSSLIVSDMPCPISIVVFSENIDIPKAVKV